MSQTSLCPALNWKLHNSLMYRNHLYSIARCGSRLLAQRAIPSLAANAPNVEETVRRYLDRISETDGTFGSFITVDRDGALKQAQKTDARIKRGEAMGQLAGIPVAVKDNICTHGIRTTAGSKQLEGHIPAYDATAVARLRAAGAIIVGKTNMDEFGMGSTTENSAFHVTHNPWDTDRVPGGSSGGSAAAVSAQQCLAALGSDTGGSIRQPAHFCGIVGVKPTYGLVSRSGLISYASSLDCIGPMASSVGDAATVLQVIAGKDPKDATCRMRNPESYTRGIVPSEDFPSLPLKRRKVALVKETLGEGVDPGVESAIREAAAHMESLGAEIEEIGLSSFELGLPAYYVIALSEASSNLSRYDGVRYGQTAADAHDLRELYLSSRSHMGAEVRRRILMGTYALSAGYYDAYYKRAQQVRTLVAREMSRALASADALLLPVAPTTAYRLGEKTSDPLAMYKGDLMTVNINLAGLPAVTLPCGVHDGLPVGMQLVGKEFGEADLLSLAHVYEQTAGWKDLTPVKTKGM